MDGLTINARLHQGTCDQTQARPDCSDCSVLPRYRGMLSFNIGIFELVHSGDFGRDLLEGTGKRTSCGCQCNFLWVELRLFTQRKVTMELNCDN